MKKLLYCAAALATLLFAASCQQEKLEPVGGPVRFTVTAPGGLDTRAYADGENVNEVHWAVYRTTKDYVIDETDEIPGALAQGVVPMSNKTATVELDLLQDQYYTILFWAQVKDAGHYELGDLREVKIKYNPLYGNDESRAAFFQRHDFSTFSQQNYDVTLYRPFAQINLGTTAESLTPSQDGQTQGYTIDVRESKMTVKGLATSFDLLKGEGKDEAVEFTFNSTPTPAKNGQTLTVNDTDYHYVAMNYLIVPILDKTVEVSYEITTDKGVVTNTIGSVPIKENYRTNIIGNLLTSKTEFEIVVDKEFVDEYNGPEFMKKPAYDAQTKTWTVQESYELVWFADQVNNQGNDFEGETIRLATDIDLSGINWTPIGATGIFKGTFDGAKATKGADECHIISNLKVATEGRASAGLFASSRGVIKNLKVVNAEVTGHYKTGVILGDGLCGRVENCHVENATVVVTPYNEDDANNVGGIVGYLSAEPTAYVKDCSVITSEITAYRKVGGIVGAANAASEVSGNSVKSTVVTADQTPAYKEVKPADAGAVVGWAHDDAVVENNEVSGGINTSNADAVKIIVKVDDADDMYSNPEAAVVLPSGEYDIDETVTAASLQVNEGSEVTINANDNTLEIGTANAYGFVAEGEGTTLEINDANIDSKGGAIGVSDGAKVTVNNSTVAVNSGSTSGRYNIYAVGEGTEVTINSGVFSWNQSGNNKRAYIYCGAGATVYVKGGTFGKASTRSGYSAGILGDGDVIITGGTFGFDPSAWVAFGYEAKKVDQNWVVEYVAIEEGGNLKDAVAEPGAVVQVKAGEYAFPSEIAEGVTIKCEEGTVFTGNSKLNINGATVIGATFSNPEGAAVDQTINGTFKNCTFEGANALRYCYPGETVVFEDCHFEGDDYAFHFDSASIPNAKIICRRCTFAGKVAVGSAISYFEMDDCDILSGTFYNVYCNSNHKECNFKTSVRPLGGNITYTDCAVNGNALDISNLKFFKDYPCALNINGVAYKYQDGLVKNAEGAVVVWRRDVLENVLNAAEADMTIVLHNDIYGDVTVSQKEGVNLVIDGAKKKYDGTIYIHGNARHEGAETLTIQNVNFVADAARDFISSDETGSAERYAHNVTVKDCTFSGHTEAVGFRFRQAYNVTVEDCVADGIHSLAQNTSTQNQTYERCTVNAGRGINLLTSSVNCKVIDCKITATNEDGYGIRVDAAAASKMEVTGSTINAYEPLVLRSAKASYEFNLASTTLVAGSGYEIVVKGEKPVMNGVDGLNIKIN